MEDAYEPYDALLIVSFGGPEGPDDVMPFLENVTRGRDVPRERLAAVGEHYHLFGGISPINGQVRELKAAIEADLAAHGIDLPVYWGNRNWKPYLAGEVRRMAGDGVRRAAALVTSAYSGYSCCRQYRDDIARARAAVPGAPRIDKLRAYYDHPGFAGPLVEATRAALARIPEPLRAGVPLAFTAHSVPLAQPGREDYVAELADLASYVAREAAPGHPWELVYQSRSGPPAQPWLEPDIGDHLEKLRAGGAAAAVAVPIGFVTDHMEVKYDLDVQAAERAARAGLVFERAATPGTHPRFVAMARELLTERAAAARPAAAPVTAASAAAVAARPAVGELGPRADDCAAGCCTDFDEGERAG